VKADPQFVYKVLVEQVRLHSNADRQQRLTGRTDVRTAWLSLPSRAADGLPLPRQPHGQHVASRPANGALRKCVLKKAQHLSSDAHVVLIRLQVHWCRFSEWEGPS
jgi:hypothetical protein